MKNTQSGFSIIEGLLILIIIGIIGFTGWYVLQARNNTNKIYSTSNSGNAQIASNPAHGEVLAAATKQEVKAGTLTPGQSNWSGYYSLPAQGQTFKSSTGTFTIPTLDCSGTANQQVGGTLLQIWNGIDGGEPSFPISIEQEGVDPGCHLGVQSNPTFYYMQFNTTNPKKQGYMIGDFADFMPQPKTGDSMTATTSHIGNQVTMTLKNNTSGAVGSVTKKCPAGMCLWGSAENIVEATGPIAKFNTVTFTNTTVTDSKSHTGGMYTLNGWWNTVYPSMVGKDAQGNKNVVCTIPGTYDLNTDSFTVTSTNKCVSGVNY